MTGAIPTGERVHQDFLTSCSPWLRRSRTYRFGSRELPGLEVSRRPVEAAAHRRFEAPGATARGQASRPV